MHGGKKHQIPSYATVKLTVLPETKKILFTRDTKSLHQHFARRDYEEKYLLQFSLSSEYKLFGKIC